MPIVYLDALVVRIRDRGVVTRKSVYIALGVNLEGTKEVLGLWIEGSEGAKFWLKTINELKNRGVEDIFIVCSWSWTELTDHNSICAGLLLITGSDSDS